MSGFIQPQTMSIAEQFRARLVELEARDRESQARTAALLAETRSLIEELEALDLAAD